MTSAILRMAAAAGVAVIGIPLGGAVIASAISPVISSASALERDRFQVGAWKGWSQYSDKTKKFRYCGIEARYRSGITVSMLLSYKGRFNVLFYKPSWRLTKGDSYPVVVSIDGAWRARTTAFAYSARGVKVSLPTTARMVGLVRGGNTLQLVTRAETMRFSLSGTSNALARMVNCYVAAVKRERSKGGENPFGSSTAGTRKANPFGAGRSSSLSRNVRSPNRIIRVAGLAGYRGMQGSEVPKALGRAMAVWTNRKVYGYLRLIHRKRVGSLEIETALVVAQAARGCKGRFSSGQRTVDLSDGKRAMRFFTVCTAKNGGRLLGVYFVVRFSDKDFALFGHYTSQDDDAAREADKKVFATAPIILNRARKGTLTDADVSADADE